MTLNMLIGILEQGLIYGIMAMGLLITYRILDFPDLTVDSSFPLGAAVSATLTLQGVAPWLTLLIGCAAGGILLGLLVKKQRVTASRGEKISLDRFFLKKGTAI